MSYRCEVCSQICQHSMVRHVVTRAVDETIVDHGRAVKHTILQIAKEIPVCSGCKSELDHGVPVEMIRERFRDERTQVVQSSYHGDGAAALSLEENAGPVKPAPRPTRAQPRVADMFDDDRR